MHGPSAALGRAREKLEKARKELSIRARTCDRYERELLRLRSSGASPAQIELVKKTLEQEFKLYFKQLEPIGRPATRAYAQALREQALNANLPLDSLLEEFMGLFSDAQAAGLTRAMGTETNIRQFVDRVCQRALVEVEGRHSANPYLNLQNAHLMAQALGAGDLPSHQKVLEIFNRKAQEVAGS